MNNNDPKSFIYRLKVLRFLLFTKIHGFFFQDSILRRQLFLPRIYHYLSVSVFFYLAYSHFDWMLFGRYFRLTYLQNHDHTLVMKCFLASYIAYTLYFLVSLFFVQAWKLLQTSRISLACLFYSYIASELDYFVELAIDFWCHSSWFNFFTFYFWYLVGNVFIEFAYNMDEEYDDARIRNSETARNRGSTILVQNWYDEQDMNQKTDSSYMKMQWEMSRTTKTEAFLTDFFGNTDDLGENPIHVAERYKAHKHKMYPEFFEEETEEDRADQSIEEDYINTAGDIPETYQWVIKNPELKRNFWHARVQPEIDRFEPIIKIILLVYYMIRLRLFFFRPRAVGLYSFYNPYYKFDKKYREMTFKGETYFVNFMWYWIKPRFINFIRSFSIFKLWNNHKWNKFHVKHYVRLIKLQRWGSGNYKFFKSK